MRMNFLFSAVRLAPTLKMALTNAAVLGFLLAGGCGKAPETVAEPVAETQPEPAQTPTSGKPSLVVQPPTNSAPPAATPARVVYVATAFQAVNSDGTHDFPARAAVNVIEEEGDEYVIEYQGVSVRTPKGFFTETLVEEVAVPEPSPVAAAPTPTPDMIPLPTENAVPEPAPVLTEATPVPVAPVEESAPLALPAGTPDPALAVDAAKATELIGEIKTLNDEIRTATDKLEVAPATEKSQEAARIEKLKKRRDRLSENLTEVAKP